MSGRTPEWQVWESDVAEAIGGSLVRCSGRLATDKGDAKNAHVLVDAKLTGARRYSLRAEVWEKLESWGTNEGKDPILAVRFSLWDGTETAVLPEAAYYDLGLDAVMGDPVWLRASAGSHEVRPSLDDEHGPYLFELDGRRLVELPFSGLVEVMR